jgi:ferredoxin
MSLEALSPDGLVAMFWQMRTHFHAVSFERTPPVEIGARAAALEARGWIWLENRPVNWIARVVKDFSDDTSSLQAENDIKEVMGQYYLPLSELAAAGSTHPPQSAGFIELATLCRAHSRRAATLACPSVHECPSRFGTRGPAKSLRTTLRRGVLGERQMRDQRRACARRAVERHCPAERLDSVRQPDKARAASWGCPADAVVSNTDPEVAVA